VSVVASWLPGLGTDQRVALALVIASLAAALWATTWTTAEGALPLQRRVLRVAGSVVLAVAAYAVVRLWA
jgi:hypothetical protein